MKLPPFTYHRPETIDEAVTLLADSDGEAKVLAGGQSLLAVMSLRLAAPESLVDLAQIPGLDQITERDGGIEIGALVTHAQAESSYLVASLSPLLSACIGSIGHQAIRNRGTVCGSLAHADPAAELPAVAVCVGAEMTVASPRGERMVDAVDFFTGFLSTDLADDEILTSVWFPPWPSRAGYSFVELSRRSGDFALVGVAVAIHAAPDGLIDDASIVYLSIGMTPVRAVQAEDALIGLPPTAPIFSLSAETASIELSPTSDGHASAAYRKHTAAVILKQALAEAATGLGAAQ